MEYHSWANEQFALHFSHNQIDLLHAVKLLSHVVNAHHIWNSRIATTQPQHGVWDVHASEQILAIQRSNLEKSLEILQTMKVEAEIDYTNTKGERFTSQIWEVFTHVNYHSAYHRGQAALLLRQNHIAPPSTDYIHYRRAIAKK